VKNKIARALEIQAARPRIDGRALTWAEAQELGDVSLLALALHGLTGEERAIVAEAIAYAERELRYAAAACRTAERERPDMVEHCDEQARKAVQILRDLHVDP
jgi:hypothetical protein